MDYFSKFLRSTTSPQKQVVDHAGEFHRSWLIIKGTLMNPDERQLARGIQSTEIPARLKSMIDSLVWESTRAEEGVTGACMEYLLKNDVLGTLVGLSQPDRPSGIQMEVLRSVQNMVVLLDEQFLVHSAVHRAVLRLLRTCVGDEISEQLDGRSKAMGAAGSVTQSPPSVYEEDLVDLLCILCSRIRTYRELLMIFFHDKNWYQSEILPSVTEEVEEEGEDDADIPYLPGPLEHRPPSPSPSQATITSTPALAAAKKPEYEFLLFNYLLRFVHREGKIGDLARAGLLFLMDVAMSPGGQIHRLAGDDRPSSFAASQTPSSQSSSADPVGEAALALAEYVLDGDFSEVLAAGLGAVYSLLPSKLQIRHSPLADGSQGNGMVIGGADLETGDSQKRAELAEERAREQGIESSSNPEFRSRLDHFLKLLEFLQDVLRRNVHKEDGDHDLDASSLVGSAIVQSILDAVRRIFLENVLYTSILECSENDGSAVAVMSYLDITIRTLRRGELAELFVNFLVSEDDSEMPRLRQRQKSTLLLDRALKQSKDVKLRRRKSSAMMLLELEAPETNKQSDYFTSLGRFNLKDLLLTNLRSSSPQTVTAALLLSQSLLTQHCTISTTKLLLSYHDTNNSPGEDESPRNFGVVADDESFVYPGAEDRISDPLLSSRPSTPLDFGHQLAESTLSSHLREMDLYLSLVSRIDPAHDKNAFSTGYEHYLSDALFSLQQHTCFSTNLVSTQQGKGKHHINPNDPILSLLLQSLRAFFSNSPELNIALTGVLASMAFCSDRSLAGWLTFAAVHHEPSYNSFLPLPEEDGDDRSIDFRIDERLALGQGLNGPQMGQAPPVIFAVLQGLVDQLDRHKKSLSDFDKYLAERRQGLLFSENLSDAMGLSFDRPSETSSSQPTPVGSPQRLKAKPKTATWSSLLTPRKIRTPSKSATPALGTPVTDTPVSASPFARHYQSTSAIEIEPFIVLEPSHVPWTPAVGSKDPDDIFSPQSTWAGDRYKADVSDTAEVTQKANSNVTLSQLLDNVVILEECIKELTAIMHARRSLGIDTLCYL
ncbi:hypothetical protein BD410DRAFT_740534 [Rickenella mellea]|uniref:FHF complex subunit HOOK-interacting protein C-terminal domain-containing protein n=1 Tax=Rickenella mellea TaxID=50990 RepID=A0A4Y7QKN9_9AGAM|nr:hypothetical protein BD410DRAFT_740534 [Rickenella mellea]